MGTRVCESFSNGFTDLDSMRTIVSSRDGGDECVRRDALEQRARH